MPNTFDREGARVGLFTRTAIGLGLASLVCSVAGVAMLDSPSELAPAYGLFGLGLSVLLFGGAAALAILGVVRREGGVAWVALGLAPIALAPWAWWWLHAMAAVSGM